jgi:hypothetical protein
MKASRLFSGLFSLLLVGSSLTLYVHRQDVLDWLVLRNYEPSPAIVRLATAASLSDEGRRLFYVHDPSLLDKANFQGVCGDNEATIVLGCYISNGKIYVFDVEDERLQGVEEVTAAHEMLHAAFDRLSGDEKERITSLLEATFAGIDDERLLSTIATYRDRDPSVVPNELHSILGTEWRELPPELEEYFSQYFLDRFAVVEKAEAYESEFSSRKDQISAYDTQLNGLSASIVQKRADVNQLNNALKTEADQLDQKRSDPEVFNAAVPVYNGLVRSYNAEIESLRVLISQFNAIVAERNEIATQERELVEAIDTRATEL